MTITTIRQDELAASAVRQKSKPEREVTSSPLPAPAHNSHPIHYRPDIDGLRAIAVLAVVVFHAFPSKLKGGFAGVDIFFVISGFLISSIILKSLERDSFSFIDFYQRRIRRIFPALLLVMGTCLAFSWFALLPDEYAMLGKHVLAGVGFVSNIVLWQESGYFDVASELKPLLHLWSLGVEEQFYLMWPVLALLAWRHGGRRRLFVIAAMLASASFALNVTLVGSHPVPTFFLLPARFWELMAGGLLAYVTLYHSAEDKARLVRPDQARRRANWLSAVGLLLIVAALVLLRKKYAFPGWYALPPVIGAMLVILAGPQAWVNRKLLANKPMVSIGLISYPLYLWHWPMLAFMRIADGNIEREGPPLLAVVLSAGLAWLTYRWLEQPIRHARKPTSRKHLTLTLILASLGLAAAGTTVMHQRGFAERIDPATRANALQFQFPLDSLDVCQQHTGFKGNLCYGSRWDHAPDVILIGDSHAEHLYPGLANLLTRANLALLAIGNHSCPPLPNLYKKSPDCDHVLNPAYDLAERSFARTVILAGRGPFYISGVGFGSPEARMDGEEVHHRRDMALSPPAAYAKALRESFERLSKANKRVIFVLDNPELGFDPHECAGVRPLRFFSTFAGHGCSVPRQVFEERNRVYRNLVIDAARLYRNVRIFDAAAELCDQRRCHAMIDGVLMYRDDDHLSTAGSGLLAEKLVSLIRQEASPSP